MKNLFSSTVLVGIVFFLVFISCVSGPTTAPPVPESKVSAPGSIQPARQGEWEKALAAAKREGSVVISSSFSPSVREVLEKALKEKYDIELQFIGGMAPDHAAKIIAERRAGLYTTDIILSGITTMLLLPEEIIDPVEAAFVLPEVKDVNIWREKRIPLAGPEGKIIKYIGRPGPTIAINKELVSPEDIKSWRSLLEPKWKGKMLLHDPGYSGAGNSLITAVAEIMGIDYLKELAKQEPVINRDYRTMIEWVARGKYPLTIGFNVAIMEDMRDAGAPLANIMPAEGTYTGAGIGALALINRAPHPNAAKVFINWVLSREGQTLLTKAAREQSNRVDVEPVLPPDRRPQEGMKYIDSDTEYFNKKRLEMMNLSKEIFAAQSR